MSIPSIPPPARLIISALTAEENILASVAADLTHHLGEIEETIGPMAFSYTKYYDAEMGPGLKRWLWSFRSLVDRGELVRLKLLTNRVESSYTYYGKRRVNLDPGLLTLANFVLATGKDNAHRIYLGEGIFADLTLVFRSGSFQRLEWTYPDYADPCMIQTLNRLRETYKWVQKNQRKRGKDSEA